MKSPATVPRVRDSEGLELVDATKWARLERGKLSWHDALARSFLADRSPLLDRIECGDGSGDARAIAAAEALDALSLNAAHPRRALRGSGIFLAGVTCGLLIAWFALYCGLHS